MKQSILFYSLLLLIVIVLCGSIFTERSFYSSDEEFEAVIPADFCASDKLVNLTKSDKDYYAKLTSNPKEKSLTLHYATLRAYRDGISGLKNHEKEEERSSPVNGEIIVLYILGTICLVGSVITYRKIAGY